MSTWKAFKRLSMRKYEKMFKKLSEVRLNPDLSQEEGMYLFFVGRQCFVTMWGRNRNHAWRRLTNMLDDKGSGSLTPVVCRGKVVVGHIPELSRPAEERVAA